ncbi:MAG: PDZ domain-containing protein [Armatimonadota bacterium]
MKMRLFKLLSTIFVFLIIFTQSSQSTVLTAQNTQAERSRKEQRFNALKESAKPWLGVIIKDSVQGAGYYGVRVDSVMEGSPAKKAGIQTGDIITYINGVAITDPKDLVATVGSLKIGEDYDVVLVRNGRELKLSVRLVPLTASVANTFNTQTIDQISDKPMPRKGIMDINVLKYILINPKNGVVSFIGTYDPTYDTGPIHYGDYLKTALMHLYPSFSLDPTEETRASMKQASIIISNDIARMDNLEYADKWTKKVADLLINDQTLQTDNKRFFRHCADVMGISGDELKRMHDAATGKIDMPDTEFMGLAGKMVRGVGLVKAGNALGALAKGGTPEELLSAMSYELGLFEQYNELLFRQLEPEEFRKEAIILCISEICRHFEAPENEIQSKITAIRAGESADLIIGYMGEQLTNYITNKLGRKMISGLVLGPEVLSKIYNLPVPKTKLVFEDLPSDSLLGDVFFKSDYRLKSVCTFPDAKEKVKSHITVHDFFQKEASDYMNKKLSGVDFMAGNRLVPDGVVMKVSPQGDIIEFEKSKIKIIGWLMNIYSSTDSETTDFISDVLNKHAQFLTENYDEYAKAYPEWHKFSEAAKIIAFARWAAKNGYQVKVSEESNVQITQPSTIDGFWSAVFDVGEDSQYITFIYEGGASFAKSEGENWLSSNSDVTITSDVTKQLAASAVFAEQAVGAAINGDLEAARELSEKSAKAMTGEIDLSMLPSLEGLPMPTEPAIYAEATKAAIEDASQCFETIKRAGKEIENISQSSSSKENQKLKDQLIKEQDDAKQRLTQIFEEIRNYKSNPINAEQSLIALNSGFANIPSGSSTSSSQTSQSKIDESQKQPNQNDKKEEMDRLVKEMEDVEKQITDTKNALLKLNASIMLNKNLFNEWEESSSKAFERCVLMGANIAVDFGIGAISDRYKEIYELAKKLPGDPKDVIEKYRYLASLAQGMKEAKAVYDLDELAQRENKTTAELLETFRDGIGQIMGLLDYDKTLPGKWWKYGTLASDTAYSLTELWQTWKNINQLEKNNEIYAEAVKKLANRMQQLVERQKEIRKKLDSVGDLQKISK